MNYLVYNNYGTVEMLIIHSSAPFGFLSVCRETPRNIRKYFAEVRRVYQRGFVKDQEY